MILGLMVFRNEADRYLARVVQNLLRYCDLLVAVDDGSTDGSDRIVTSLGGDRVKVVRWRGASATGFWEEGEAGIRAFAWSLASDACGPDDWVYIADSDHELTGISPEQFKVLGTAEQCTAWAFPLYDCWDSDQQMRVDGYWQAHRFPRPWLVKAHPHPDYVPQWDTRAIHVGHLPFQYPLITGYAPGGIKHLGYIKAEDRLTKHHRYRSLGLLAQGGRLTDVEAAHAESIVDPSPALAPVPGLTPLRVLIGSVVRKPPQVLKAFLDTLLWQRLRQPVQLGFVFLPNYNPADEGVEECLQLLRSVPGAHVLDPVLAPEGDYGEHAHTRKWTGQAFGRLAEMKDRLMQMAVAEKVDYLWLVDADVLNDPYTLQSLLDAEAPIVAGVYWTQWQRILPDSTERVHAGPQVWLRHPYFLDGNGWTEAEFRTALVNRARVQVWGLGANTLFHRQALEKGVDFAHFAGLPPGPMSEGEDRHLCARATALHVEMVADSWPDVFHAYHPTEYPTIPAMLAKLGDVHPSQAKLGDLVSVKIKMLEPVNDGTGRMVLPHAQWLRGRVGSLKTLPQIEEMVAQMPVGETVTMKVAFPAHYPYEPLRGQNRVMDVTLLDAKSYRIAPVIDGEILTGPASGAQADATTLTAQQIGVLV